MRDIIWLDGRSVTMAEIVAKVANEWDVPLKLLMSQRRRADVVWPRHVAMYLCALDVRRSFPQIGRFFDRDHTSILYAERRVEKVLAIDKREAQKVERIVSDLGLATGERTRHLRAVTNLATSCGKLSRLKDDEYVARPAREIHVERATVAERA